MTSCEERVFPYFNRCVVFSTTSTSYHGHPDPLNCPEGETRKSIALYYYSKDRPAGERAGVHNTLFEARPGEELAAPEGPPPPGRRARLRELARQVTPPIVVQAVRRLRARRR